MKNKQTRVRKRLKKRPPGIEISRCLELPGGEILEVAGEGFLMKAPAGTDQATLEKAVRKFLVSERSNRD